MYEKKESIKLGIILLLFTAITGLILGYANKVTQEPIKQQIIKANNEALKETLPMADSFKNLEGYDSGIVKEVSQGLKGDKVVGYAIKVAPKGYAGIVEVMVGISLEGKVEGIKILSQNETPGLGANSINESFYGQYKGKLISPELKVVKTKPLNPNEIQALTGATITSKAVTSGVNEAIKVYETKLKGGAK